MCHEYGHLIVCIYTHFSVEYLFQKIFLKAMNSLLCQVSSIVLFIFNLTTSWHAWYLFFCPEVEHISVWSGGYSISTQVCVLLLLVQSEVQVISCGGLVEHSMKFQLTMDLKPIDFKNVQLVRIRVWVQFLPIAEHWVPLRVHWASKEMHTRQTLTCTLKTHSKSNENISGRAGTIFVRYL